MKILKMYENERNECLKFKLTGLWKFLAEKVFFKQFMCLQQSCATTNNVQYCWILCWKMYIGSTSRAVFMKKNTQKNWYYNFDKL